MCRLCDIRDELAALSVEAKRATEKYTLALATFADAAKDDDKERMESARLTLHELLDMVCDHTYRESTLKAEAEAFILKQMRDAPRST